VTGRPAGWCSRSPRPRTGDKCSTSAPRRLTFTLKDQNGQPVTLSSFRGAKNVLLVFFPLAFTGICQGELD
jgi:alkyl hydroperoxide reductase subunit AhpC